jgi:hypothetical protein
VLGVQAIALGLIGEMIVHLNASRRANYRFRGDNPGPRVGERRNRPKPLSGTPPSRRVESA